jgi:hypothetical protein
MRQMQECCALWVLLQLLQHCSVLVTAHGLVLLVRCEIGAMVFQSSEIHSLCTW